MEVNNHSKNTYQLNYVCHEEKNGNVGKNTNKLIGKINGGIFIVHGHDLLVRMELKNYLQNTLKLPEPIILEENMSTGLTIIENFEKYADKASLVFVLLTPDDFTSDSVRARQNVIFELGYFMGKLGRKSGRIVILCKGDVEIPSDLSGILFIRIDNGILAAGEQIREVINNL